MSAARLCAYSAKSMRARFSELYRLSCTSAMMYTVFHVAKDLNCFFFFARRGLEVEQTTADGQIVLHPMVNFPQQSFLPLFTGPQIRDGLVGDLCLSHKSQNPRHRNGECDRRCDRRQGRKDLHNGGYDIVRDPDGDHFHKVCATTRNNEETECQEHLVKGDVSASLAATWVQPNPDSSGNNKNEAGILM